MVNKFEITADWLNKFLWYIETQDDNFRAEVCAELVSLGFVQARAAYEPFYTGNLQEADYSIASYEFACFSDCSGRVNITEQFKQHLKEKKMKEQANKFPELKPFMRVKMSNGHTYGVVRFENGRWICSGEKGRVALDADGVSDSSVFGSLHATAVFHQSSLAQNAFDLRSYGEQVWEYEDLKLSELERAVQESAKAAAKAAEALSAYKQSKGVA